MNRPDPVRHFRCAHPQVMADSLYAWPPGTDVTWYFDPSQLPASLTSAQAVAAIAAGIGHWPLACGVKILQVTDPAQARLVIGFTGIDGPYGILGETELPAENRADVTHTMRLDITEPWTAQSLEWVVAHEFGHGIGLVHAPTGTLAVMDPYYNADLTSLQPWDVAQAQLRYGSPATPPVSPTPATLPAPSTPTPIFIDFHIDTPGDYRLSLSLATKPA